MNENRVPPDVKSGFAGVFAANPTPLTEHGEIHEPGLRAILEDNMSHGVHRDTNCH